MIDNVLGTDGFVEITHEEAKQADEFDVIDQVEAKLAWDDYLKEKDWRSNLKIEAHPDDDRWVIRKEAYPE